MSVVSGENLVPPVFTNAITTNLSTIPVTAFTFATSGDEVNYTTPTLQQGSKYLLIVNVLITDFNGSLFTNSITGNISNDIYTIVGNSTQFYENIPPSTNINVGNNTFQTAIPISSPTSQTYEIKLTFLGSPVIPTPIPTINPTGSFIQILQLA